MNLFKRKSQSTIGDTTQFVNWLSNLFGRVGVSKFINPNDANDLFKAYYGTVYTCINKRSMAVAGKKWKLFTTKQSSSRSKAVTSKHKDYLFSLPSLSKVTKSADDITEIIEHPILDAFWQMNDTQNEYQLKQGTITYQDIEGDAFWYVPRGDALKQPVGKIYFLKPQYMNPIMETDKTKAGDIKEYLYKEGQGQAEITYKKEEIVWFSYFNPGSGIKGHSPTRAACESISLDKGMVDFLFDSLANRLRQEMMLTSEGQLQENTIKIIQSEMDAYRKQKKDKIPILPGNLKMVPLSGSIKDLPFVTNRKLERELIYNVFGVPISMATSESSNRAVQEASEYEFSKYTILPLCEQTQQQINQVFIPMFGDDSLFISFDDPVPRNRELELKERTEYVKNGIRTIDEVRVDMNDEPIGIDYPMINGVPVGQQAADQAGKALVDAVKKELGK
jgi:HK97 family phage portal protein